MDRAKAKEYGSEGIGELQKFTPGSPKIVCCLDPDHFMSGKVNEHRYVFDGDAPDGLYESVHDHGVEQPGMIWWADGRGHIISGTRRWLRLLYSNLRRAEESLPPRSMKFEINSRWSKGEAIQKWRRANQHAVKNDALTRLEGAALELEQGVALDELATTWQLTEKQIERSADVLTACEELKRAVALGELGLAAAFRLVKANPTHEAQLATLATPKVAPPKRKYMGDIARNELRTMLTGHLAGQPMNPQRLGELLALL